MRRVLLALAAAAIALPAAAHAEPPFRKLGPGEVWTDGERYAVMSLDGIARRVFDDRTGRTYPIAPPRWGCWVAGVAGGTVLWNCPNGDPMLTTLDSGSTWPVPGWDGVMESYDPPVPPITTVSLGISGFGARWLQVEIYDWSARLANRWLDWHDGRVVGDALGARSRVIDLDARALTRPLCAPLRRRIGSDDGVEHPVPHVYERPWLFVSGQLWKKVVTIRRCGTTGRVVLARCRPRCRNVTMGAGWVTWARGEWAFAYDLRHEHRRRIGTVARRPSLFEVDFNVWHTRNRIYLHTNGVASTVYVASLRRRGA